MHSLIFPQRALFRSESDANSALDPQAAFDTRHERWQAATANIGEAGVHCWAEGGDDGFDTAPSSLDWYPFPDQAAWEAAQRAKVIDTLDAPNH